MKFYLSLFFGFTVLGLFSQEKKIDGWLPQEIEFYNNLKGFAEYVDGMQKKDISLDTLFTKYIYSENGKPNDSLKKGTIYQMYSFDTLFSFVSRTIDSIGLENLDAKPLRFYKKNEIYRPFKRALADVVPFVMVYYKREDPDKPLGTLLFHPDTHKVRSWILISQGDSGWYYIYL